MELPWSISNIKRTNIKEILEIWNKKPRDTSTSRTEFNESAAKLGWVFLGCGSYKKCMAKDSIIAKYIPSPGYGEGNNEIQREFQQWKLTPPGFKKYLPITYAFHNGLMVQDRILIKCTNGWNCKKADEVCKEFCGKLSDTSNNHGHTLKGTVKFFDWVYNRMFNKVQHSHVDFLA